MVRRRRGRDDGGGGAHAVVGHSAAASECFLFLFFNFFLQISTHFSSLKPNLRLLFPKSKPNSLDLHLNLNTRKVKSNKNIPSSSSKSVQFRSSCSYLVRFTLVSVNPTWFLSFVPKWVWIRGFGCCEFGSELVNDDLGSDSRLGSFWWYDVTDYVMLIWGFGLCLVWKFSDPRRTHECSWYFDFSLCLIWKIWREKKKVFVIIAAAESVRPSLTRYSALTTALNI